MGVDVGSVGRSGRSVGHAECPNIDDDDDRARRKVRRRCRRRRPHTSASTTTTTMRATTTTTMGATMTGGATHGRACGRRHRAHTTHRWSRHARPRPPRGVEDETNFAPIDGASDGAPGGVAEDVFGPEAVLLVGFTPAECAEWREILDAIGADFIRVVACDKAMTRGTLGRALETVQEDVSAVKPALGVPRMMFMSGMNGREVMELIGVYEDMCEGDREWAPAVFACAVPKNYDSPMSALLAEIMDDHERLTGGGGGGAEAAQE